MITRSVNFDQYYQSVTIKVAREMMKIIWTNCHLCRPFLFSQFVSHRIFNRGWEFIQKLGNWQARAQDPRPYPFSPMMAAGPPQAIRTGDF
jgi:hypothetical protein